MSTWRMKTVCDNCPFSKSPGGIRQAAALRPGRLAAIKRGLLAGAAFYCHKTVGHDSDDEGDWFMPTTDAKLCAGALAWQNARGASSNYQRVAERLDDLASRRKVKRDA